PVAKLAAQDLRAARVEEVVADPGDERQALRVVAEVLGPLSEDLGLGLPVRPQDPRLAIREVEPLETPDRVAADGLLDPHAGAPRGPEEVVVAQLEVAARALDGVVAGTHLDPPGLLLRHAHLDVGKRRRGGPSRPDLHARQR